MPLKKPMNTGMRDGKLIIDMAEADDLWNSLTMEQQYEAMCIMFDPLLDQAIAMKRALQPFNKMAGELFARNYDAPDVVLEFANEDGEKITLDFADFLVVRDALDTPLV